MRSPDKVCMSEIFTQWIISVLCKRVCRPCCSMCPVLTGSALCRGWSHWRNWKGGYSKPGQQETISGTRDVDLLYLSPTSNSSHVILSEIDPALCAGSMESKNRYSASGLCESRSEERRVGK